MVRKSFILNDPILHLPIEDTDKMWYVKIMDGERQFAEFYIALSRRPDFYCPLYLHDLAGKTVTLCCDDENVSEDLFDGILEGGTIEERPELYPGMYEEQERQQVHFSSRRGWLNDPNGLVYADGKFRMCYQHNPYGPNHGGVNVSWGLAVSEDGVHFTEYPDAVRPWDSLTHIASGSAVVDEQNLAGKGTGTILASYTALESEMKKGRTSVGTRGQILDYSTDGGYTFHHLTEDPIIPVPAGEWWRDPKILQVEDGSLCIAVYETYEEKNCVSFYSSSDCIHWEFRSRTMDLYECPDLFPLTVTETGEELWVLYGGAGYYSVGKFENFTFTPIGERHHLDYGTATYAGQTWNSHPSKTERYHIAWFRDPTVQWRYDPEINRGVPFAQSMTLLCVFTLHATEDGYRLFRNPLPAFETLRNGESAVYDLSEEVTVNTPAELEVTLDAKTPVTISVNGKGLTWNPENGVVDFTGEKQYCLTTKDPFRVRIILDTHSAEFFVCGEVSATYAVTNPEKTLAVTGDASGQVKMWKLNSIWEK